MDEKDRIVYWRHVGRAMGERRAGLGSRRCSAADPRCHVYPVTGPVMKSVSILVEDGKIADIGAKIAAPKGARIIEGKGRGDRARSGAGPSQTKAPAPPKL